MKRGDWVVYENAGKREIGRVWSVRADIAAVCYNFGCTPARTSKSMLRPYDRDKDDDLVPDARIGHYRFEPHCPDYDEAVCGDCKNALDCK